MSTKHTPGPWHADIKASRSIGLYDADGTHIAVVDAKIGSVTRQRREHDARLIAAAPELLGALKSAEYAVNITRATLMDSVETHGTHGGWLHSEALRLDSELDLIRAAIAKATGSAA